jgi:putrescine importer
MPVEGRFKRVLSNRDLILYGLVILTLTAPYPLYGMVQKASHGHAVMSYLVAMAGMLFTGASYAKMSAACPSSAGSRMVEESGCTFVGLE